MRVIALGFFDGVHLGHQALLRECVRQARDKKLSAACISFDAHPSTLLTAQRPDLLTLPEDRERLMRAEGIEELLMLHFDTALMHMSWDDFVRSLLVSEYEAAHLVCGADFRFGYQGTGNCRLLQALCDELGIGLSVVPPVCVDGEAVSSTRIRTLLQSGAIAEANTLLGHPYRLTGTVLHGRGLGHTLGFPTANLDFPAALLPPAFGVYACMATLPDGSRRSAVVNLGRRPTVDQGEHIFVEAWVQDYDGDLYGAALALDFCHFLRPERRFENLDALRMQVLEDGRQARALLAE
ncbi:MAG: bifunctional riboflavin kinase/FAD synthetase [Oscillospiraceae bacterium]|nr:bifunctional riboflavin kinase/FAD synthetase [Oscillospiraceae bacterium]